VIPLRAARRGARQTSKPNFQILDSPTNKTAACWFSSQEETVMKTMSNRQVRIPGPREHDVAEHCRKFGIGPAEEKKLKKLLGSRAPLHEIQANAPPRQPRWR
jgi:hypothetical protein